MCTRGGLYSNEFQPSSQEVAVARIGILKQEIKKIDDNINDFLAKNLPAYLERAQHARLAKEQEIQFLCLYLLKFLDTSLYKQAA